MAIQEHSLGLSSVTRKASDVTVGMDRLEALPGDFVARSPKVVVVAEDGVRARRLVVALARGGISSSSWARTVDELLRASSVEPPSVAVLSCDALRDVADMLAHLHKLHPMRVIVVATTATRADVRTAFAAGADGLVLEEALEASLASAVHAVSSGLLVLPRADRAYIAPPALSVREKQVLGLVVLGFSNPEIAAKLHVAETTVKSHLTTSFRKLGVRSRSEASARILDPHQGLGVGILSIADDDLSLDLFDHS